MKRWLVAALAAAVVASVIGGLAFAASRDGDHGIQKKEFLSFIDVTVDEAFVDVAPEATGEEDISPGDSFFFRDELWNRARTKQKGTLQGACTFLFEFTAHCEATVFLSKGTIELEGGVQFTEEPSTFFVAITGGTERYENVVGEARVIEEVNGEEGVGRLVLELIPSFRRP